MHNILKRTIGFVLALVLLMPLIPLGQVNAAALKQGSRGTQVSRLQQNLIGLGYLEGNADGSFGAGTKAAVRKFQADFGLRADGSAGNATQTALRNAVVRLQAELKNFGFTPGSADGHFGNKTKQAVKAFQTQWGLKTNGIAGAAVHRQIDSASGGMRAGASVRKGSSGTQVRYLQQALIGLGFLTGSADGRYGPATAEAVRRYQSAYGLTPDGNAGPNTMTSLKNTVVTLQCELMRRGWYSGSVDGVFGSGTKAAVKAYQNHVGVPATGVAGPKTNEKLYGYSLGGEDGTGEKTYKIWIDPLYQDGDLSQISYYNGGLKHTTVEKSGCGGVAVAMAVNALQARARYTGQKVMQWFANNGYYWGEGTKHEGIREFPRTVGLKTAYCGKAGTLKDHLLKGRLAVVLIRDRTGEALFTYSGGGGHYVLVSGYRVKDGVDQVFINNPLSYKSSKWFNLDDLMDNVYTANEGYPNPFVIIYK